MVFRNVLSAFALVASMSPVLAEDMADKEATSASTIVATVNGTDITLGHVISALSGIPAQFQSLPNEQLYEGLLTQLVQQELLKQSADGVGDRYRFDLENQERQLIAGEVLQKIEMGAVTEEGLKAAYDARFAEFEATREFSAAHILVTSEEEATMLIEELEAGKDFAELAMEKSTGPSGPNGGDLGWFGMGMMVAPFEAAVLEMEAGDISAPVQTQFGWHVIKLNESRLSDVPPLEDVREELELQIRDAAIRDEVDALQSAAQIDRVEGIDPALIRNTELLSGE